jgi:phospholipase/lecithinase/hemolysin
MRTYDLAYGGATIDSDLIVPYEPTVISMKEQVLSEFIPIYSSKPNFAPWSASNSLFSFFIGINDVGNTYPEYAAGNTSRFDTDWIEYVGLVDEVYQTGARNFLFLNVPPVNKAPVTKEAGTTAVHQEATEIKAWNERLLTMASNLTSTYSDASAFVFDTNRVFRKILTDPRSFVQTRDLKNLTDYCVDYENGTAAENTFVAECIYPVNEYFWLNSLHPTYAVHNATASELVKMLSTTDRRRPHRL